MPNSRSKLKRSPKPGQGSDGKPHSSKSLAWILLSVATMLVVGVVIGLGRQTGRKKSRPPSQSSVPSYVSRMPGTITYCRDIAPIIYNQCAPCHHAGQAAPFTLLSYQDVKKRAEQIVDVTQSRYMPPWLPEPGYGRFANERRLSVEEKGLLKQWVLEGGAEGDPKTLPPAPTWPEGWMLGKPDLVVTMPESFSLEAAGPDVYRNFVIPVTIDRDRYVRAIEFVPGNFRIVHHAFIKVDATGASRKLDARDSIPGFPGMNSPAEMPKGQFLSWQPGKIPSAPPENLAWLLRKNSDLVLQEHLNRTGKPEILKSSVGLYFTDVVPSNSAYKLDLTSMHLDFPAGASNVVVSDTFTLPVDVEILAVCYRTLTTSRSKCRDSRLCPTDRKNGFSSSKNGISAGKGITATNNRFVCPRVQRSTWSSLMTIARIMCETRTSLPNRYFMERSPPMKCANSGFRCFQLIRLTWLFWIVPTKSI